MNLQFTFKRLYRKKCVDIDIYTHTHTHTNLDIKYHVFISCAVQQGTHIAP